MNPVAATDYLMFVVSILLAVSLMFDVGGHTARLFAAGTIFGASLFQVLLH